jgi:hypothetical protein
MKAQYLFLPLILGLLSAYSLIAANPVTVPAGVSHDDWGALLQKYVDDQGLVAYGDWKSQPTDLQRLNDYLAQFATASNSPATGDEAAASLINLYNALTVRTILENYPLNSIQSLAKPFETKRLTVSGEEISLNDIEHNTLRPSIGYRAHAVLVCAARSCPPLQRFAYENETLNPQIASVYRTWLGRKDLNLFVPDEKTAEISSIFSWFEVDFIQAGGTRKILAEYGPDNVKEFLSGKDYEITYMSYNWGLNDQGAQGRSYSRIRMLWDRILDILTFWK